jgi:hypothetical protein
MSHVLQMGMLQAGVRLLLRELLLARLELRRLGMLK